MTPRYASGSSCSPIAVEPVTSVNSKVTVRRDSGSSGATRVPHSGQNLLVGEGSAAAQVGQVGPASRPVTNMLGS